MAGQANMTEEQMLAHSEALKAEEAKRAKDAELAAAAAEQAKAAPGAEIPEGYVRVTAHSTATGGHFRAGRFWAGFDGDGEVEPTIADVDEKRLAQVKDDKRIRVLSVERPKRAKG